MSNGIEVAKTLVRKVMRAFYSTQEVLVIDALVTHSAVSDLDLSYLLKINTKDLHKLCASLRDARFLVVHSRPEMVEGRTRPTSKTYYYIDYRQTIDAIKWRVHKTDKDMQTNTQPVDETKEYTCPRCNAQWTQMEVLDTFSPQGFHCGRCNNLLELSKEQEAPGHQQLSRMNHQFKFMTDLLQQIDTMVIPECTFDNAIQHARVIVRDSTHEVQKSIPVEYSIHNKPSAVKGLADTGPKTMQVTISDGNGDEETIESRKRKERLLAENALPSWYTNSSLPTGPTNDEEERPAKKVKNEDILGLGLGDDDDDEDMIFEDVGPTAKKVKLENDAGGGEEEEDDIDFEDVV
ncbi:transcription initiation factor IIE subunit alpha [Naviculisporaceae sp. PSN 640]